MVSNLIRVDMYLVMLRSRHIIFSHETALFLHDLSERTPFIHAITIPNNASIPATIKEQCKCYYVKPALHEVGMVEKTTTFGNSVRCYDPERTLCDILRSRNRMDEETVISAIKSYSRYKDKNLLKLGEYAELFKVVSRLYNRQQCSRMSRVIVDNFPTTGKRHDKFGQKDSRVVKATLGYVEWTELLFG